MTTKECSLLFGGAKKFKIKSPTLKLVDKVVVEDIYWKVFEMNTITNNEMHAWIMHGFIAQSNGNQIDLAKTAKSTQRRKHVGMK